MRSCFFKSIAQDRLDRKLRIPEEPENSDPNSIRVLIKLPNGKRLERRFLKSHSLQVRIFSILFFFKFETCWSCRLVKTCYIFMANGSHN